VGRRVLDESPVADAIRYAVNQKVAPMRLLDDAATGKICFAESTSFNKNWRSCLLPSARSSRGHYTTGLASFFDDPVLVPDGLWPTMQSIVDLSFFSRRDRLQDLVAWIDRKELQVDTLHSAVSPHIDNCAFLHATSRSTRAAGDAPDWDIRPRDHLHGQSFHDRIYYGLATKRGARSQKERHNKPSSWRHPIQAGDLGRAHRVPP
jgi:hypothetical protein